MRTSGWIVGGLSIMFLATAAQSAENQPGTPAMSERIAVQRARLPEIEATAGQQQKQAEQEYMARRAAVAQEIARQGAAELSLAQRAFWTEFAQALRGGACTVGCLDTSHFTYAFGSETVAMRQAMIQEYYISQMASLLLSDDFRQELTQIVEERLYVPHMPLLRRQARDLLAFMADLQGRVAEQTRELEESKTARVEAIMKWESDMKDRVHGILQYLKENEARETHFGVVESVGYCPKNGYYCMVEGVDRVLAQGDTVGGVRVLSIDPEKVEFSKGGATWTQKLGAPAEADWQQTG